jgi:hypothetical protein
MKEIDFSDQIKYMECYACSLEGTEEEISEEAWSSEKNKGKKLNKPFRTSGGPKKFSVYVKNDKGNTVKVNFGDPNMEIKRDDPNRRKSFRARHNCSNPGPKWKARYWSCRMWSGKSVNKITKGSEISEEDLLEFLDESEGKQGLWDNIRKKKKRMGKKYRAAKPGEKGRPDAKSFKKAQKKKEDSKGQVSKDGEYKGNPPSKSETFKPHKMYDKNGKSYMAKTKEDI